MCEILAKYLIELVEGAKGNVVSFVVGDVARWAETKVRPTRSVVFKITNMAEALLAAGLLEKIGKKYILKRDSPCGSRPRQATWRECAKLLKTPFSTTPR